MELIKPSLRNFILILSYILSFAIVTTSDYLTVNHDKCDYQTIELKHALLWITSYVYPEVYHEVYRDTCVYPEVYPVVYRVTSVYHHSFNSDHSFTSHHTTLYHHSFNSHHTEMNRRSIPITMIKMWKRW